MKIKRGLPKLAVLLSEIFDRDVEIIHRDEIRKRLNEKLKLPSKRLSAYQLGSLLKMLNGKSFKFRRLNYGMVEIRRLEKNEKQISDIR